MLAVLIAQFLSALADNMLLFIIIGLVDYQGYQDWVNPILQQSFLISYIVLAPFVGAVADGFSKGRVMLLANLLKCIAVGFLLVGGNAFIAYGMVGIGACIYSPAKYGILKEIKGEAFLVKANAMIEGSTMAAILSGVVLGGLLADYAVVNSDFTGVILLVAIIYILATVSNLFIPKLPVLHKQPIEMRRLLKQFFSDFAILWRDFPSRISLLGTGLFFGIGATMRFWLIAWVPLALGIDDNKTPAMLNAIVAVGIVIGAGVASRIPLSQAHRVMSAGVGLGVGLIFLSMTTDLYMAYFLLTLTGVCGGLFLVPLNAVLQKQGHSLIGGGHAIAIQNFIENGMMLLMLFVYMGLSSTSLSSITIGLCFGVTVVVFMLGLRIYGQRGIKHAE